MIKALYVALGTLTLGLGVLGIVLPLLPTTPMLLLTAYFYAKGSKRFHDWFVATWLYKRYLKNFAETRSMTRRGKWTLMIVVDVMLLIPFLTMPYLWIRILIVTLAATKYLYFFTQVKTVKRVKKPMLKT